MTGTLLHFETALSSSRTFASPRAIQFENVKNKRGTS